MKTSNTGANVNARVALGANVDMRRELSCAFVLQQAVEEG